MYYWNSTCDGDCFVLGETTQFVVNSALHSRDSGIHTCSVTDYVGNTGTSTIQITVSGISIIIQQQHIKSIIAHVFTTLQVLHYTWMG